MWEESQAENTRLRLELSGVKSDLETARYQLDTAAKQAGHKQIFISICNKLSSNQLNPMSTNNIFLKRIF